MLPVWPSALTSVKLGKGFQIDRVLAPWATGAQPAVV